MHKKCDECTKSLFWIKTHNGVAELNCLVIGVKMATFVI